MLTQNEWPDLVSAPQDVSNTEAAEDEDEEGMEEDEGEEQPEQTIL